MDYTTAEHIRKQGLGSTLTDKLLSGAPIGYSIKSAITERTKASVVGIKQKFDPLNIARIMTGGSKLGPAILGRLTGRSQEDIGFFSGKKRNKDPNYTTIGEGPPKSLRIGDSKSDVLAKMYNFMHQDIDLKEKRLKEEKRYRKELDSNKERQLEQIIDVLKGKSIQTKKSQKDSSGFLKYGVLTAVAVGGMLFSEKANAMVDRFSLKNLLPDFGSDQDKTQSGTKITATQGEYQKMVFNSFVGAGFSNKQAMALTAEVGRENAYQPSLMFGEHIDPANKVKNVGIFSWQGARRDQLLKELENKGLVAGKTSTGGVLLKQGQETLDVMAKFAKKEMETQPSYAETREKFLKKPDVEREQAAKVLGENYLRWRYNDPRYAKHKLRTSGYYREIQKQVEPSLVASPIPLPISLSGTPTNDQQPIVVVNNNTNSINGGTTYQYSADNNNNNSQLMNKQYGYN